MHLTSNWHGLSKLLFRIAIKGRTLLPKQRCNAFGLLSAKGSPRIQRIYVINLTRQPARWAAIERELKHVTDCTGVDIWNLTERCAAIDASLFTHDPCEDADITPFYTLGDQLRVEPQPLALPSKFDLDSPIRMSRAEVAIALSHINIWRQIAAGPQEYALVLEDDVWFRIGFSKQLNLAWNEIASTGTSAHIFDMLYVSYEEVLHGAPKTFLSDNVFRPARGLWHLSGYVLSRKGAHTLLRLLPCRGPVDLWLNHQFGVMDVRATRTSIISQRPDLTSTNSYSILPALTKIGAITGETASLFHIRPNERPVFAFGPQGSGLSSLAMALSMLGYRCCSDLQSIPSPEYYRLLAGHRGRIFDAYVNITSLEKDVRALREQYPHAKFIITTASAGTTERAPSALINDLNGADITFLYVDAGNKWQVVCDHLRCAPPVCSFPVVPDVGQRQLFRDATCTDSARSRRSAKRDKSPWVIEHTWWRGIHCVPLNEEHPTTTEHVSVGDRLEVLNPNEWLPGDDTFAGNLALFRPSNIEFGPQFGAVLNIRREALGVRKYGAASLRSRDRYLYGRFEAVIKASNVPGVVTGLFLHRDSPRQEIDIEITGNKPSRILANVFYNPGGEGAKFDYGYRGAGSYIDLGFDASESFHQFAIEWRPCEIRWFVDDRLVHRRVDWDPTPIPHLPMAFHINAWLSSSRELAGRVADRRLPTASFVRSITLNANRNVQSLVV